MSCIYRECFQIKYNIRKKIIMSSSTQDFAPDAGSGKLGQPPGGGGNHDPPLQGMWSGSPPANQSVPRNDVL